MSESVRGEPEEAIVAVGLGNNDAVSPSPETEEDRQLGIHGLNRGCSYPVDATDRLSTRLLR